MLFLFLSIPLLSFQLDDDRPVIRLEDGLIEGKVKKPSAIEINASPLNSRLEELALKSLIKLEKRILDGGPLLNSKKIQ